MLDRDAVLVPAGWDSWGKINVLREGFEPGRVCKAWERSLSRGRQADEGNDEGEGIEDLWMAMVPDTDRHTKVCRSSRFPVSIGYIYRVLLI